MAKMNLYVMKDVVAGESGPVFEAKNDLVAIRNVKDMMKDVNPLYYCDFKLICLGRIDHETDKVILKSYDIDVDFACAVSEHLGDENNE